MLEISGAILLAVLILVYIGEFTVVAAMLFGTLLVGVAAALVYFLRVMPGDVALGILGGSVLIASISREANDELRRDTRAP